jgi:hypothetical protein
LANLTGPNRLLRNVGDGTFTHAIDAAHPLMASNAQSTDAAWVALHAGERPSLYVANWDAANHFFVNNQDGTFSEMALEYGIRDPGNTVSVAWGDFLAGQPALALGRWDQQPLLYARRNSAADQPVQPFHDITYSAGVQHIDATLTVRWFDANADGQLDLLAVMANGGVQLYQHTRHPAEDVCYTP